MKKYIVNYTIKADGIEEHYTKEVLNIFEGFGEIEKRAKEINGTIYRNYSKVETFEEQIYKGGYFSTL